MIKSVAVVIIILISFGCAPRTRLESVYNLDIASKRNHYSEEERKLYESIIKETPKPVRIPETIVRVLVLPYVDKNGVLHSHKYTFLKLEDGKWIFDSKESTKEEDRVFKPLSQPSGGKQ